MRVRVFDGFENYIRIVLEQLHERLAFEIVATRNDQDTGLRGLVSRKHRECEQHSRKKDHKNTDALHGLTSISVSKIFQPIYLTVSRSKVRPCFGVRHSVALWLRCPVVGKEAQ